MLHCVVHSARPSRQFIYIVPCPRVNTVTRVFKNTSFECLGIPNGVNSIKNVLASYVLLCGIASIKPLMTLYEVRVTILILNSEQRLG
jgi:hypothetical protein